MDSSVINIKTDPKLKSQAQQIAKDLGFSLSSVINAYLRQFVRTKSVSFSLYDESRPSKGGIKALKESQKDVKEGRLISFNKPSDALDYLDDLIQKDIRKSKDQN